MRQIKFRAWHKKKKIMWVVTLLGLMFEFDDNPPVYSFPEIKEGNVPHYSDVELMQYTGLKDKNGEEIYEGDIIRYKLRNEDMDIDDQVSHDLQEVIFKWGSFRLKNTTEQLSSLEESDPEIIGNIYENKKR